MSDQSQSQAADSAQRAWEAEQAEILARYPAIGISRSPANVRFVQMFRVLGGRIVDPVALADLVMIYPPKSQLARHL